MSAQIGQILIKENAITEAQLDEAIQAQVIYGGKLGTNLVELDLIDLAALSKGLSLKFKVPTIDDSQIKTCSEDILNLLGKKLAAKYRCVPLSLEGSRLSILMEDPTNLSAFDDIAFATGKKIEPYVAPELIIVTLLEKYYGIQRDMRYIRVSPATPQPPQPEVEVPPTQQPEEEVFRIPKQPTEEAEKAIEEVEIINLEDLIQEAPVVDLMEIGAQEIQSADIIDEEEKEEFIEELELLDELPEVLTLQEATQRLSEVKDRDELAKLVLSFAHNYFKRSALFITRFGTATGWDGMGGSINKNMIKSIMMPLNEPSIFKTVFDSQAFFLGAVPETPLNKRFLQLIGGGKPLSSFLIPILFKGQVVNILYGDNGNGQQAPFDISELLILAPKVPQAFEDLIRRKKSLSH